MAEIAWKKNCETFYAIDKHTFEDMFFWGHNCALLFRKEEIDLTKVEEIFTEVYNLHGNDGTITFVAGFVGFLNEGE